MLLVRYGHLLIFNDVLFGGDVTTKIRKVLPKTANGERICYDKDHYKRDMTKHVLFKGEGWKWVG